MGAVRGEEPPVLAAFDGLCRRADSVACPALHSYDGEEGEKAEEQCKRGRRVGHERGGVGFLRSRADARPAWFFLLWCCCRGRKVLREDGASAQQGENGYASAEAPLIEHFLTLRVAVFLCELLVCTPMALTTGLRVALALSGPAKLPLCPCSPTLAGRRLLRFARHRSPRCREACRDGDLRPLGSLSGGRQSKLHLGQLSPSKGLRVLWGRPGRPFGALGRGSGPYFGMFGCAS